MKINSSVLSIIILSPIFKDIDKKRFRLYPPFGRGFRNRIKRQVRRPSFYLVLSVLLKILNNERGGCVCVFSIKFMKKSPRSFFKK